MSGVLLAAGDTTGAECEGRWEEHGGTCSQPQRTEQRGVETESGGRRQQTAGAAVHGGAPSE